MAQAVGWQAIKLGFVVLYRSIFDVVRDFLHENAVGEEDRQFDPATRSPDLADHRRHGHEAVAAATLGEVLFEIIMRRYETRSTMMTSNRPLEDWGKLIGDVPSATAILDRFLHHAEVLTFNGRSYRLRKQTAAPAPALTDDGTDDLSPAGADPEPEATAKPSRSRRQNRITDPATACQS